VFQAASALNTYPGNFAEKNSFSFGGRLKYATVLIQHKCTYLTQSGPAGDFYGSVFLRSLIR
jgi:hypothetical protein